LATPAPVETDIFALLPGILARRPIGGGLVATT
jgi:hypothetical protein